MKSFKQHINEKTEKDINDFEEEIVGTASSNSKEIQNKTNKKEETNDENI